MIHISLIGAFQRDEHKCFVQTMEPRVLAPSSRPTPESLQDIRDSNVIDHIETGAVLYSDGAPAWPGAAKRAKRRLRCVQVKHKKQQFTKKLRKKPTASTSKVAGTQLADSSWKSLKKWVPPQCNTCAKNSRKLNGEIVQYIRSWQWRYSNRDKDLFAALAKAVRKHNC